GLALLAEPAFWWCVAGIAVSGVLNVGVSFWLAFKVALRSRGVHVADRARIRVAIRRRMWSRPLDFVRPPA
ncbi:MAG: recombinase, partial [Pseudomonadota bacterium]